MQPFPVQVHESFVSASGSADTVRGATGRFGVQLDEYLAERVQRVGNAKRQQSYATCTPGYYMKGVVGVIHGRSRAANARKRRYLVKSIYGIRCAKFDDPSDTYIRTFGDGFGKASIRGNRFDFLHECPSGYVVDGMDVRVADSLTGFRLRVGLAPVSQTQRRVV